MACAFLAGLFTGETSQAQGQNDRSSGQALTPAGQVPGALRVVGRHFRDNQGRAVILRGVNLAGDSKVPPFDAPARPEDLDRLASLGFNVIRLLLVWEAYEPAPGVYRDDYLAALIEVARQAHLRGIRTIIDFHQDGFSRYTSRGCGDGFPAWAVSPRGTSSAPDNGEACRAWPLLMATDPTTHKSFADFFNDTYGVRTRYLAMVARVSAVLSSQPGVVGYDLLNEPWGSERRELAPLYRQAIALIRANHPSSLVFIEGHITTNMGLPTGLPRPTEANVAYAPHYYHPITLVSGRWHGMPLPIQLAFKTMTRTSKSWDVPLFLGEFGVDADVGRADDYVAAIYRELDRHLASGAQWNVTPGWNPRTKDGWNDEDFSILTPDGRLRANFRPRPYPRLTGGTPVRFEFTPPAGNPSSAALVFGYDANPATGATELFVPAGLFAPGSRMELTPAGVASHYDQARQVLTLIASQPGPVLLTIRGPTRALRTRESD